jgi:hypothetical protein
VIQLEYSGSLKDQDLNYLSNTHELIIFFVVVDELKQNFSKEEPILVGFGLSDEEALVPQRSLSAYCHQELNNGPQTCIVVCLRVELL